MYHKKSDSSSDFLVWIILFIVALVIITAFMVFYFHGGVNLFNSVKETNGTNLVNDIETNNFNP